ncbi:MAG: hypothetical protein ABSA67_09715 [Candidatus Brocadiia bacterium]|jgi:hypothetical protein
MKTKLLALLLAAVLATCAMAAPDAGSLPPIIRSGLAKYKADGAQAAVNAWMIGSPIALSEEPQHQVHALRAFEGQFGVYQDFHVVRIVSISPTTQMIYIQLDYVNGPAFGKFLAYQARESWNVVSFGFGADPEVVWGLSLFGAPDMQ